MPVFEPDVIAKIVQLSLILSLMLALLIIGWAIARYFFQHELDESRRKLEQKKKEMLKLIKKKDWEE
ncbi:MAG: hypothetical protein V2G48_00090 [bacterium JZ-2024 1]